MREPAVVTQDPRPRLCWSNWLALLLVVGRCTVSLLACSSPPDQVWIPGIYDVADYDDVVGLVVDTAANERASATADPARVAYWRLPNDSVLAAFRASLLSLQLRSPPTT